MNDLRFGARVVVALLATAFVCGLFTGIVIMAFGLPGLIAAFAVRL